MKIFEILVENQDENVTAFPVNLRLLSRQKNMINEYNEILALNYHRLKTFSFKEPPKNVSAISKKSGFINILDLIEKINSTNRRPVAVSGLGWKRWLDDNPGLYQNLKIFAPPEKLEQAIEILKKFKNDLIKFEKKFEHFKTRHTRVYAQAFENISEPLPREKMDAISEAWGLLESIKQAMSSPDE